MVTTMSRLSAVSGILLFGHLAVSFSNGQTAASPVAFEAASVKVAASGSNGVRGGCRGIDSVYSLSQQAEAPPRGRCVITDARLSQSDWNRLGRLDAEPQDRAGLDSARGSAL